MAARKRWRGSVASVEVVEDQEAEVLDERHVPLGNSARERRARRIVPRTKIIIVEVRELLTLVCCDL
jgi:hypothetical protein